MVQFYPKNLPEHKKRQAACDKGPEQCANNILLPASSSLSTVPLDSSMSVEMAERLVKEKPQEVKVYLKKHLQDLECVKFLTMGEVEELLTMTGLLTSVLFL